MRGLTILTPGALAHKWSKALYERITNNTATCIHIPFRQKCISAAVSQFSVNNKINQLTSPLSHYSERAYINWGYKYYSLHLCRGILFIGQFNIFV
jgi:hypothetical protein